MSIDISKTGILTSEIVEPFLELPDGSNWQLLLYHYNNKGTNLFTQANAGYCDDLGLYSRLNWIDNFIYNNKYEFYVIQDGITHRWSQTNAPLTSTAITGYTSISGNAGGGICKGKPNYKALIASTNSNTWWRACGAYSSYSSGGITGVPGFGNDVIAQHYTALYARIGKSEVYFDNNNISASKCFQEF